MNIKIKKSRNSKHNMLVLVPSAYILVLKSNTVIKFIKKKSSKISHKYLIIGIIFLHISIEFQWKIK